MLQKHAKNNPYIKRVEELSSYIKRMDEAKSDAVFQEDLKSANRVIVELCSGSGMHLIERAAAEPNTLFIGFELRYKRSARTIEKALERGVENVRIVRDRAEKITELFEPESVSGVYINFPDPWEKRKRRKNRLLNAAYLNSVSKILKPDGFFAFKTDHQEYFESFVDEMEFNENYDLEEVSKDLYQSEYLNNNVPTEFEGLFLSQNLPIYYCLLKKA